MRISKEEALEYLSEAKNYWNAIHVIADAAAKNTTAGRVYLFMQATAGGAIIDTANGDTLDEQLVGIAGDLVGGAILVRVLGPKIGTEIMVSLTIDGNSPGDLLKSYYKDIKTEVNNQYWDYVKDWDPTSNITGLDDNTYNPLAFAKVKVQLNNDGTTEYYRDNAAGGIYIYEEIYETEYNAHYDFKNSFLSAVKSINLDTKIEVKDDGVLYVTMPDGTIIVQGTETSDPIYGSSGNDFLFGMYGDDYIDAGAGDDYLDGVTAGSPQEGYDDTDADTLQGGKGFDTYIAGDSDIIMDEDGIGRVMFDNSKLTGGKQSSTNLSEYIGNGGSYKFGATAGDRKTLYFTKRSGEKLTIGDFDNERMVA